MRSTGDRRLDETIALSEYNVKRRKAKHLPTTGKRVYATVDGRGTVGRNTAAKIKIPFSNKVIATPYMTGFGEWVSNRPSVDPKVQLKNAREDYVDAKEAKLRSDHEKGMLGGLIKPTGSLRESQVEAMRDEWGKEWDVRHGLRGRNKAQMAVALATGQDLDSDTIDKSSLAVNAGLMFLPFGRIAKFVKGAKEADHAFNGLKAAKDGSRVAEHDLSKGTSSFKKWSESQKAAAKKSPREMKRGVEIAVSKSKGSRKASSFKKWSESQKPTTPKKPAPKPKPISDEVVQFETAAVDPRQPRPLSMALLRPTEPDYLQGWHLMNINAPTWYTPFRVWRNPSELA